MRSPSLAEARKLVLQVGHIERFSSAYRTLAKMIADPLYFESYRIAPWKNRGVEVDVILDLMIHDIDMIIGLVELARSRGRCGRHAGARPEDRPRQCPHHLRVGLRRQRHGEPGELQDRAAHARVRAQSLSQLRSRRGASIFGYRLRGDPMTEGLAAIATETYEIPKQDSLGQRDRRVPRLHRHRHQAAGRWPRRLRGAARGEHDQREHRGTSGAGSQAPSRPIGGVALRARSTVDDVEHDFGGALARRRLWVAERLGHLAKALQLPLAHFLGAEDLGHGLSELRRGALLLDELRHHLAAGEQVHQRGVIDAHAHAADEEGGGRR